MSIFLVSGHFCFNCSSNSNDNSTNNEKLYQLSYLVREAFYQDGNQQVEEDIIAKGHQGHKIQGRPMTCPLHTRKQNNVPVLLSKNLWKSIHSSKWENRVSIWNTKTTLREHCNDLNSPSLHKNIAQLL